MIIDFTVNVNTYRENILENYSIIKYTCPKCGATHSFIRHGSYNRHISTIDAEGNVIDETLYILRLYCKSCKSTHAILPNDVIPYCIYSYSTIINVLSAYYIEKKSVKSIAVNISFQVVYSFISKFTQFLYSCLLTLKQLNLNVSLDAKEILKSIIDKSIVSKFPIEFFSYNKWMFLMIKFHNVISAPVFIGAYRSKKLSPT